MKRGERHDPEVRARMSAARKAALADPEVRARMSAASKAAWADPEEGPHHLRGLIPAEREVYCLCRRKGFNKEEALHIAVSGRKKARG